MTRNCNNKKGKISDLSMCLNAACMQRVSCKAETIVVVAVQVSLPVNIVLNLFWHVKVDDVLNIWKVQSFGCNISGH